MKKSLWKIILFTFFSIALVYLTFNLIGDILRSNSYSFNAGESFLVAFLINLYSTGIFAMIGFVLPSNKILPSGYYKIHNSSSLITIYKVLGVSYFRLLLLLFFWGNKKNRKKYFNGTKSGLVNFIYQSKQSEIGHLAAFLLIFLICIILVTKGFWSIIGFTILLNIIGNLYPVILQRYHRIRIAKLIN